MVCSVKHGLIINNYEACTVLCKSNESEFRRISRHFATFRRKPTIFLTKRNIAELSTNFRKRYCLDTFEISKLYANVPAKLRTTIREDSRNFEGNVSKFRTMLQIFEACFEVQRIFEAKLGTLYSVRRLWLPSMKPSRKHSF